MYHILSVLTADCITVFHKSHYIIQKLFFQPGMQFFVNFFPNTKSTQEEKAPPFRMMPVFLIKIRSCRYFREHERSYEQPYLLQPDELVSDTDVGQSDLDVLQSIYGYYQSWQDGYRSRC